MKRSFLRVLAVMVTVALMLACYRWTEFGWFVSCTFVVCVALLNATLDVRSSQLGIVVGTVMGMLTGMTSLGAGLAGIACIAVMGVAALVGYVFGSQSVSTTPRRDGPGDETSGVKSGRGGDFGGGGASGGF